MSKITSLNPVPRSYDIGLQLAVRMAVVLLAWLALGEQTLAHGFGEQLDLNIPLWLWLGGAALTVLLSFAVVIDFLPSKFSTSSYPQKDISNSLPVRLLVQPAILWLARGLLLSVLFLTIVVGIFGRQIPEENLTPSMVWVIFWVGLTFSVSLLGNFWRLINPFATIYYLLFRSSTTRQNNDPQQSSAMLADWSAVATLTTFMFVEHLWPYNDKPAYLAILILAYVMFTIGAMKILGPACWLSSGEIFSIVFEIFGRFAPIRFSLPADGSTRVFIRAPAVGLLDHRPTSTPIMVFIFVLLAGVTFDGLIDIPQWRNALFAYGVKVSAYLDIDSFMLTCNFLLLLVLPAMFFLLFWLACLITRRCLTADESTAGQPSSWHLMKSYVTTLIPIAIAYHFAHYLTFLLVESQQLIPLLSDPLGLDWNLFATANYTPNAQFFSAKFVWYFVVVAIVIGHMLSVYLAHLVTLTFSNSKSTAVKAGTPILVLMVLYTVISLWIIAQPALPT